MAGPFDYAAYLEEAFDAAELSDMTFNRFCELAISYLDRRRLILQVHEEPVRAKIIAMCEKAFGWAKSEYRISQIRDEDLKKMRPKVCLMIDLGCCSAAEKMRQSFIDHADLVRLPLAACDRDRCTCQYSTLGRREIDRLANAGLLTSSGSLVRPIVLSDLTVVREKHHD